MATTTATRKATTRRKIDRDAYYVVTFEKSGHYAEAFDGWRYEESAARILSIPYRAAWIAAADADHRQRNGDTRWLLVLAGYEILRLPNRLIRSY